MPGFNLRQAQVNFASVADPSKAVAVTAVFTSKAKTILMGSEGKLGGHSCEPAYRNQRAHLHLRLQRSAIPVASIVLHHAPMQRRNVRSNQREARWRIARRCERPSARHAIGVQVMQGLPRIRYTPRTGASYESAARSCASATIP
jgi:hypothetical protein